MPQSISATTTTVPRSTYFETLKDLKFPQPLIIALLYRNDQNIFDHLLPSDIEAEFGTIDDLEILKGVIVESKGNAPSLHTTASIMLLLACLMYNQNNPIGAATATTLITDNNVHTLPDFDWHWFFSLQVVWDDYDSEAYDLLAFAQSIGKEKELIDVMKAFANDISISF
jgi:hypothetical protein